MGVVNLWVPQRREIIWIDCNPQKGQEMKDMHPFLVISPQNFNDKTSLVVGFPLTTAQYNANNPFAVLMGKAKGNKAGKDCFVLCHQIKSFDWRVRESSPNKQLSISNEKFEEVLAIFNQIAQVC